MTEAEVQDLVGKNEYVVQRENGVIQHVYFAYPAKCTLDYREGRTIAGMSCNADEGLMARKAKDDAIKAEAWRQWAAEERKNQQQRALIQEMKQTTCVSGRNYMGQIVTQCN